MCIDPVARAESLDIDLDTYESACEKLDDALWDYIDRGALIDGGVPFQDYPKILSDDEMTSYARWNVLYKCAPDYFSWDGFRYDLHPEAVRTTA